MLLRNAWYIGAWADELGDKPLARRICGEPVVLFRDGAGKAAALVDRCCHRAARLAQGWIASPGLTRAESRAQADLYRERCAAYGKEPNAVVLRRDIYVGQSSSEAQAVLQQALSRGYRGMPPEALVAGSVVEVAEQFRSFAELGYTDILVRHLSNDQPKVLGSLERLAAVRAALA